jgi:transposase
MRARVLQLHPMTAKKLWRLRKEAEVDGVYRVARRLHAVLLNHEGNTSGEIATLLDSPRSRVSEWLKNYDDYGYEGLLEGYRPGRPPTLTSDQKQTLEDILDSGPVAYNFTSGVWTSPMVARVIQEEFGVDYHPGHVRKLMHQLGFTVQRPRRKLARADPQKQDRWHRHTYPNLKKKPKRKERR